MPRENALAKASKIFEQEVIGLIPAAGQATRLAPLPCSKELFPIGFRADDKGNDLMPKVVCHYLMEKIRLAGITKAYIVTREGKWDIHAYFGDGTMLDMHLAYLMMGLPYGVPYTIDQAYHFVKDTVIAFGFPDMFFDAEEARKRVGACTCNCWMIGSVGHLMRQNFWVPLFWIIKHKWAWQKTTIFI